MNYESEMTTIVDGICEAVKQVCEKANSGFDLEEGTRAEIYAFVLYLMMDDGSFDRAELEELEKPMKYSIDKSRLDEFIKIFRVDSEENYLSQPPEIIDVMMQADNLLYETDMDLKCVDTVMQCLNVLGEIIVNNKGFLDEGRNGRFKRFLDMVEKFQYDNAKNPAHRKESVDEELERVIPSKKGVSAPKKS